MAVPQLAVLKTKAESRALAETLQVWTVELPVKAANNILITIKESIPDQDSIDLQHLRRFAKPNNLPLHLRPPSSRSSSDDSRPSTSSGSRDGSTSSKTKSKSRSRSRMRRRRNNASSTMHLLVCPASLISFDDLSKLFLSQPPFVDEGYALKLREVTVPMHAPTSVEQAQQWTAQYWPAMYRKTNPYGPHPTMVNRAEEELLSNKSIDKYMTMARTAAVQAKTEGFGISAGCVIVQRTTGNQEDIVAVAGDARHGGTIAKVDQGSCCTGNVAGHAVLRAIGMVARKRVRVASPKSRNAANGIKPDELLIKPVSHAKHTPESVSATLLDYPLTAHERTAFEVDNLVPDGYLCVDLEIYLTHEPCLMCSMAIVHSRFSRCIFLQKMPASGGFAADSGLGYGLFWRSELNWKLLCWEWTNARQAQGIELVEDTQV